MDFPGNSIKQTISKEMGTSKEETPEERVEKIERLKKVTTAKPVKKTFGQSLKDVFIVDGRSFADYLVQEVIIPAAKDIVVSAIAQTADGIKSGIEQKLFGEVRRKPTTSYGTGRPVVNYGASYKRTTRNETTRSEENRPAPRRSNVVEKVRVESRDLGDEVLLFLDGKIDSTGFATVGDFYDLVDITPRSTDDEWGWDSLAAARIERLGIDDYLIKMPPPKELPR